MMNTKTHSETNLRTDWTEWDNCPAEVDIEALKEWRLRNARSDALLQGYYENKKNQRIMDDKKDAPFDMEELYGAD